MSPLVLGEILEVFVNILIADDTYPVQDCENLTLAIQMQLFEKQKILKEKMLLIANVFPKLQTVKNLAKALSKKHCFRQLLDSEHVKESQILVKYSWERFNHVFSSFSGILI